MPLHTERTELPQPKSPLLQEIVSARGQPEAAVGFALTLAAQICGVDRCERHTRQVVWVRQSDAKQEVGDPYWPGLAALGIDPGDLLIVQLRTFADTLRAGLEAVRCSAFNTVLIETIAPLDLTASRRLKLAAEASGVMPILIRHKDVPVSNAASIRWHVRLASRPERDTASRWRPIQRAAFEVTLAKHPSGLAGKRWVLEWDHERREFNPPLSLPLAAVPRCRSLAA